MCHMDLITGTSCCLPSTHTHWPILSIWCLMRKWGWRVHLACLICKKKGFIVGPRKHSQLLSRNRYQCVLFNVHSKSQSSKQRSGTVPDNKPFISHHNKDFRQDMRPGDKWVIFRDGRSNLEWMENKKEERKRSNLSMRRRCSWSPITSYFMENTRWPRALSTV